MGRTATLLLVVLSVVLSMTSVVQASLKHDPRSLLDSCSFRGPLPSFDDVFPDCVFKADFIVASGGTGGLAAARTLLDAGFSVIVLEPGQYRDNDPNVWNSFNYQQVTHDYSSKYGVQLKSTIEPVLGVTYDVAMARMWGGSNNHNGEMYVKPSLQYLQQLAAIAGTSSWSVSSVQSTFKQIEKYNRAGPIDPLRGTTGSLDVRRPADGPTTGAGSLATFLANSTAGATGLPITADYNGANSFGPFARYDLFQKPGGNRSSSSTAFFPPSFMYPNGTTVANLKFRALFESTVVRVIFFGTKAIGVEYLRDGRTFRAFANKEIVLGGSLFSAQILQQSGIGPASLLQSLGIDVLYNNPNVGTHTNNHPTVTLDFDFDSALLPGLQASDPWALYLGGSFLPSWTAPGKTSPSQLQFPRKYQVMWLNPYFEGDRIHMYIIQLQPKSEGLFEIQSKDPLQAPRYQDNFYTNSADLDDFASFLFNGVQKTLLPYMKSKNSAFGAGWTAWNSIDDAKAFILAKTTFNYHYVAANRLGQSPSSSVVDPRGRVWGVSGLRIADTSILPFAVDGNTAAMASAVGRTVAQLIIKDNRPSKK